MNLGKEIINLGKDVKNQVYDKVCDQVRNKDVI